MADTDLVPAAPTTEAGKNLWRMYGVAHIPWLERHIAAIEAEARAQAGHRIGEVHDCFLMNCHRLGPEVQRLRDVAAQAAERAVREWLDSPEAVERLDGALPHALSIMTEGTEHRQAPQPSDEPGSLYVEGLARAILAALRAAK